MSASVATNYRRNKQKKAIKKDLQTIVIIIIISILFVVAVVMGVILLNSMKTGGQVSYPTSPLVTQSSSKYSYIEDSSLPYMLTMPSEPVMISVGGSQRSVPYNGYVYLYDNDLYLSVYEMYGTSYDLYSTQFISDLYDGEIEYSWLYEEASTNKGYFNGYPTEYQCGECNLIDGSGRVIKTIYLVSFTMDLGLEKPINITVSTPSDTNLFSAGKLLEKVGNTIMDVSETNYVNETGTGEVGEADMGAPAFY